MPFYGLYVNMVWTGLTTGLMLEASILVGLQFTIAKNVIARPHYAKNMTMVGTAVTWHCIRDSLRQ